MDVRALERLVAREAGLTVGVEERGGKLVLTGFVQSPAERQAAEDVVLAAVPHAKIENEIEIEAFLLGGESALESAVDHVEEGRG